MEELFFLYDNLLIYYPNIFFLLLLALLIVGSITLYNIAILANEKITNYLKEFKTYVKKIKIKIKKTPRIKTRFPLIKIIKNLLLIIILLFTYVEVKTERIIKRIEKKILIDKE